MRGIAFLVGAPPLLGPVLRQPGTYFAAKGVAGFAEIVFRKLVGRFAQVALRQLFSRCPAAAEAGDVEMHAAEMPRRLVLFGITDGTEGVMRFQGNLAQRGVGKRP